MSRIEAIEDQITELSAEELASLRDWFLEYDAELWKPRFAADIEASKLNEIEQRALSDVRFGILQLPSKQCSRACGKSFSTREDKSETSCASLQESWPILVGPYRLKLPSIGRGIPDGVLWFWIGTHAEYDRLIG